MCIRDRIGLVRVAPRRLDDDNLAAACKALRDGIAEALGVDDGSPTLRWSYGQEQGRPSAVRVTIEAR